ncbi:MAG: hypothetical protein ACJA08_002324 [Cyclobacteriaceae bacterium]|jgi:hypothetical protein
MAYPYGCGVIVQIVDKDNSDLLCACKQLIYDQVREDDT